MLMIVVIGSFYEGKVNRMREAESLDREGWLHLEDDFVSVNVFQVPHCMHVLCERCG